MFLIVGKLLHIDMLIIRNVSFGRLYALSQLGLQKTKISQTGWLKQQTFSSHNLKAEKSKIKVLVNSIPGEGSFWLGEGHLLIVFLRGWGREKESWQTRVSSNEGTDPIMKTPPHDLI